MKYDYGYILKLQLVVGERLAPSAPGSGPAPFECWIDVQVGTMGLSFPNGLEAYATPFWEDCLGLPVQTDCNGDVLSFELPFFKSGDLERDAEEYIRLCSLIPTIIGTHMGDRPKCDCRQFKNLGRCEHTDDDDREPPEEPSGYTGPEIDYGRDLK